MRSETTVAQANQALRALIMAGEAYRQAISTYVGLGVTETQAISHMTTWGDQGSSELAARLGITTSAATSLIDRLEERGIAERYDHPHDRRRVLVRLTDAGRAVITDSRRWFDRAFDRIPDVSIEAMTATLTVIAEDLQAQTELLIQVTPQKDEAHTEENSTGESADVTTRG